MCDRNSRLRPCSLTSQTCWNSISLINTPTGKTGRIDQRRRVLGMSRGRNVVPSCPHFAHFSSGILDVPVSLMTTAADPFPSGAPLSNVDHLRLRVDIPLGFVRNVGRGMTARYETWFRSFSGYHSAPNLGNWPQPMLLHTRYLSVHISGCSGHSCSK